MRAIDNPLDKTSRRNLKHISKHLSEFQAYDPQLTLEQILQLGLEVIDRPENFISKPGGREIFEQEVCLGKVNVRVRVVLNPNGNIRSIHIRKHDEESRD